MIAERFDRRRVMIVSNLLRAAIMFGLAAIAITSGTPLAAVLLAFLATTAGTSYLPAMGALTPTLVPESSLAAANALLGTVTNVAIIAGPAVGAVLLLLGSPAYAFAINGASFLFGAFLITTVRVRTVQRMGRSAETVGLLRRLAGGFSVLRTSSSVVAAAAFGMLVAMVYGTMTVLLLVAAERLSIGADGVGWLYAALGAGGILATKLSSNLADRGNLVATLAGGIIIAALPVAALAWITHSLLAVAVVGLSGAAMMVVDILVLTFCQRTLPPNIVARLFGLLDSVAVGMMLLGSILAAPLVGIFGARTAMVIAGVSIPILSLVFLPWLRRGQRKAQARRDELKSLVDELALVPVFQGAQRQSVEWIAGCLERTTVPAGTLVIRQGDPATDFWVIHAGTVEVLLGEPERELSLVATLGAGDYFGEIGLVEGIPRTANVRTVDKCVLYRIGGEDFLGAMNERQTPAAALINGVISRLAQINPTYEPAVAAHRPDAAPPTVIDLVEEPAPGPRPEGA
jgi:MFS family permease